MAMLTAGVGTASITPPVGYPMHCLGLRREVATGIHDDLHAKALVLDGDGGLLAIVALDVVHTPEPVVAEVRDRVTGLTGIPGERVMLASSHNHTTPDFPDRVGGYLGGSEAYHRYRDLFVDLVGGAVYQAYRSQQPARLGGGQGRLPGWTTNRRHPERAVDDAVRVIRVDREDGEPLACLANFACHALAVGGQYLLWTADFPGYAAQVIERAYPGAAFLFLQGAHGDVLPFDWYFGKADSPYRATYENARRIGFALGGEVLKVMQGIQTSLDVRLGAVSRTVSLPGRTLPWTREEAERVLQETLAANPDWESERWTEEVDHGNSALLAPGYYRLAMGRNQLDLLTSVPPELPAELQVFRMGDAVIAANPSELFASLGTQIAARSPAPHTLVVSCANGSTGYVPARQDYDDLAGIPLQELVDTVRYRYLYGVATSRVDPGAGEKVVEESLNLLAQLRPAEVG